LAQRYDFFLILFIFLCEKKRTKKKRRGEPTCSPIVGNCGKWQSGADTQVCPYTAYPPLAGVSRRGGGGCLLIARWKSTGLRLRLFTCRPTDGGWENRMPYGMHRSVKTYAQKQN